MSTPYPPQAPAAAPEFAPQHAGYVSPIPVRSTHLGHALASEWTKIKSVRSTTWTLSVLLLLEIGIGLLVAAQTADSDYLDTPVSVPGVFGLMLGQICVITLGVLVVSSEYGTGMIRTTLTACPQRWRVLAAKMLVFFVLAFVVTAAGVALVVLASSGMHSGPEVPELTGGDWARAVLAAPAYISTLGLLAVAVGSMLRHSAGAITAMLGVVLLPPIMAGFLSISESTAKVGEKMAEYNVPNSISTIYGLAMEEGAEGGAQFAVLAVVTAVAVAAAFALLAKRDV
ncbi:ABC transporter permease subunit [Streptomyces sp. NPDC050504]|uniref:ABC transporter permease subunit n=1 Tax=Streptomyces sp. NPDC050504 TaxID=3365618 RepID=UPI0037966893